MKIKILALLFCGFSVACSSNSFGQQDDLTITQRAFYKKFLLRQEVIDIAAPAGATVIIGDSIMFYLPDQDKLGKNIFNLSIVGDTTSGIESRIDRYRSIRSANCVILEGGVNDLPAAPEHDQKIVENYRTLILEKLRNKKIILIGIFPVDEYTPKAQPGWNSRIKDINSSIFKIYRLSPSCNILDLNESLSEKNGNLRRDYHRSDDGIHPNKIAYDEIIIPAMKNAISNICN